uniref:Protein-tyrosine-phosphatase n=1 Tax=Plectus sambesii TaxID=2011161 RepID=A0A914XCX4_9BILA
MLVTNPIAHAAVRVALVAPPERVRVQATSNSSVVVTWTPTEGEIDGYVVKFIHEPSKQAGSEHHGGGQRHSDSWQERMVPDKAATHVEISGLLSDKPYAFCVLAVRDARQGACSDPPVTIEQLKPLYMVSNLRFVWKTDHSVMLNWEYNGPMPIKFLVSQTGRKNYLDQFLAPKSMVSPSMRFDVDGHERSYKWTSLRPYMEYTFLVGVESIQSGEEYWPKQVTAKTSAAGPPFVDSPEFLDSQTPDRATVKLKMASEEYGPISHYWLIVVPANFSQEDLPRLDNNILRAKSAIDRRRLKRATDEGAYISMELEAAALRKKNQTEHEVVIGDNKEYGDFRNHPLDAKEQYKLMLRAFAVDDDTSKSFDMLVPPQETKGKLWSDSMLSKPFNTKAVVGAGRSTKPGNVWLIGPVIAILIITVIVGMLIIWWMKRNKKKQPHNRHGSITKVALGPNANSETSKLLVGQDVYGRQPMNPYDHMNGNGGLHADPHMEMYPLQQGMGNHYAPVPVPLPVNVPSLPSIGHSLSHPPIPITELATHLDRLKANDCMLFSQEYESIETGQQFTWEHSNMEANKPKNRYANVVAYDHSRVMLTPLDHGQLGADYINANYIDGYRKSKAYIATQGPLPETFADFWRMVWDEQTVTIVMLTKLEERSRIKCDQYWPMRGAHSYGQVQVTLVDTLDLAHYTIRTMRIQRRGEPEVRDIRHLQFTAWPDHGVPDHPTPFLMFLKRVKSLNPPEAGPVTVHCSAGIGRTGAFIAIDCMLERLRYENTVDVFGCVTALRSQRSYMVQTEDQYVFIHDAVLDAVQSGSTEVPAGKLFTHIQALMQVQPLDQASGMELEFRHLAALKMLNCRCSAANLPANKGKNRLVNMVPFDSTRVRLLANPGSGEDGVDYINASWIDGYRQRRSYIATQGPLPNTIDDFWRMLWEHESCIVVMLTKLRELGREKCSQYYPSERSARYGQLVIEPIAEYNMPQYVLREFKMTDTTNGQSRTIRHFQYMDWPEQGSPKSGELFVEFI